MGVLDNASCIMRKPSDKTVISAESEEKFYFLVRAPGSVSVVLSEG